MQQIVLISGFGGTGKTTVSNMLLEKLQNAALIEADHLFQIQPFEDWNKIGRIKTRNTHALIETFLQEKFEYILCSGYVWSQAELDGIVSAFKNPNTRIWLFWLSARKEVRHARVNAREPGSTRFLEQVEETFVKPLKLPLLNAKAEWKEIETTDKKPAQITEEMLGYLQL